MKGIRKMNEVLKNCSIVTHEKKGSNGKTYVNYYLCYKGSYVQIKDYSLICNIIAVCDLLK